ncbi:MAG: SRPBCC domain-containing protein [Asticcacaulis sp.]
MNIACRHIAFTERDLKIERLFQAPRALVYEAWTNPALLSQWWGPVHYPATHMDMQVAEGSHWRNGLKSVESGEILWQNGTFRVVKPLQKLVFSFVWEAEGERGMANEVTVIFADGPNPNQTLVTLYQHPFHSLNESEGHGDGWWSSFDRLQTLLSFPMEIST